MRAAPAADNKARVFAAIHARRKKMAGLDDEDSWRDFLERETGKRSLRAMDGRQLGRVLDALHAHGSPASADRGDRRRRSDRPWVWKARALWRSLHALGAVSDPSERALGAFCRRQGCGEAAAWLGPEEATRVIDALKAWCAREGFRPGDGPALDRINRERAAAGMAPVDAGWRAKLLLVQALLRRLPEAGGVAQLGERVCATSDMSAGELDQAIEDLGAAVRRARAASA